jgi:hypothetical protein
MHDPAFLQPFSCHRQVIAHFCLLGQTTLDSSGKTPTNALDLRGTVLPLPDCCLPSCQIGSNISRQASMFLYLLPLMCSIGLPSLICTLCNHKNPSTRHYCGQCSAPLQPPELAKCGTCKKSLDLDEAFCGKCGTAQSDTASTNKSTNDWPEQGMILPPTHQTACSSSTLCWSSELKNFFSY